ncbi:hypothetical protein ACLOJK_005264 [Asimina triloba]
MAFLRSIATASVLPAAGLAFVALSSSSSHPSKLQFPIPPFSSLSSKHSPHHLFSSSLSRTFAPPPQSAIRMDSSPPTDQKNEFLPQLLVRCLFLLGLRMSFDARIAVYFMCMLKWRCRSEIEVVLEVVEIWSLEVNVLFKEGKCGFGY